MKQIGIAYLIVLNLGAFILYGIDKNRARHHRWRISESTLLLAAVLGGSIGAWAGMQFFHHKTRKNRFRIGVPLVFLIQVGILLVLQKI